MSNTDHHTTCRCHDCSEKRRWQATMTAKAQPKTGCVQGPCSVSATRREVIENKLLDALSDDGTVAILASESDLKALIAACEYYDLDTHFAVLQDFAADLRQLLESAFPQNDSGHPTAVSDPD